MRHADTQQPGRLLRAMSHSVPLVLLAKAPITPPSQPPCNICWVSAGKETAKHHKLSIYQYPVPYTLTVCCRKAQRNGGVERSVGPDQYLDRIAKRPPIKAAGTVARRPRNSFHSGVTPGCNTARRMPSRREINPTAAELLSQSGIERRAAT